MIDVKKLINPIITCAMGVLSFIFLALNFFTGYLWYGSYKFANGYSFVGDGLLGYAKGQWAKVIAFIFVILVMITSVVLIAIGVIKLLEALGIKVSFLDPYEKIVSLCDFYGKIAYVASCGATFLFMFIFALCNLGDGSFYLPGVGCVLLLIFAAIEYAGLILVDKFVVNAPVGPKTVYVCAACGAKAAQGTKFCPTCGGNVVEKIQYPVVYVCSGCGAKAKADDKFCSACGGAIVKKELIPTVYFCSACGQAATENDKFCANCGGAVVSKQMGEQTAPKITTVYYCSACGKGATADDKFCDGCGGAIVSKQINE